jgi:alginate O-acetyltransferase complex protein AlgI
MLNKMFVFDSKSINFISILEFGVTQQIDGLQILFIFFLSTILIFTKNTNELLQNFKVSRLYIINTSLLFTFAFLFLNKNSTFLYFNF